MARIGPLDGRKPSRRGNNSFLGAQESYHHYTSKKTIFDTSPSSSKGYHSFGMRDMDTVLSGAYMSGTGLKPISAQVNWGGTESHRDFANTTNTNNEDYGGGSVGLASNETARQTNRMRHYEGRKPQSNYPYFRPMFSVDDVMHEVYDWAQTSYGGANSQTFRDINSPGAQWRYRQIIAMTYTGGGYKDGSPWRQIHRTIHSTDQTTNLGNLMDHPGSYCAGACNDTTFYMYSTPTDNAHSSASTRTSAIHMFTETGKSHNGNFDAYNSRQDLSNSQKNNEYSFFTGAHGPATFDVMNLTVECRFAQFGTGLNDTSSAFQDKDYGYHWDDNEGRKVNFYTFSSSGSTHWAAHGQQKGIPSTHRIGYCGNEGSYMGGYNFRRWNLTSDSNIGNVGKIQTNMGEENFGMGMDWQYMIGNFDGAQNNESHKLFYATDTGNIPSGSQPTANAGQSSGHCAWRA